MARTEVKGSATIKPARTGFLTDSQDEKLISPAAIITFKREIIQTFYDTLLTFIEDLRSNKKYVVIKPFPLTYIASRFSIT